jgi:hypothetical protein
LLRDLGLGRAPPVGGLVPARSMAMSPAGPGTTRTPPMRWRFAGHFMPSASRGRSALNSRTARAKCFVYQQAPPQPLWPLAAPARPTAPRDPLINLPLLTAPFTKILPNSLSAPPRLVLDIVLAPPAFGVPPPFLRVWPLPLRPRSLLLPAFAQVVVEMNADISPIRRNNLECAIMAFLRKMWLGLRRSICLSVCESVASSSWQR